MSKRLERSGGGQWPKQVPVLTPEQSRIADDWMEYFFQVNKNRFSGVIDFGHKFVARNSRPGFVRTLEIGAGLGDQLAYEELDEKQMEQYVSVELRKSMAGVLQRRWPKAKTIIADCQERLPYPDGHFDRILAIHVLEHLPNLPAFLAEADRLLDRPYGQLLVVIPCEGGLGYSLGRRVTSQRMFEKRYNRSYRPFIEAEHVNSAREVLHELRGTFSVEKISWYPVQLPSIHLNLCVGLVLRPYAK
ncbi:MAG: class I SAM-dependent methyltransferase [Nitrospirota bacterium]